MEMIKNDIIKVISKYMVIDAEGLDIQITSTESEGDNGSVPAIYANIPIKDMRQIITCNQIRIIVVENLCLKNIN